MASLRHGFHGRLRARGSGCQCGNTLAMDRSGAAAQAGRAGTPGVAVATARRSALTGVDPATYTDAVPLTYRAVGDA